MPKNKVPSSFIAGDTVTWEKSLSDYPASDGWVMTYIFVKDTKQINVTGIASGDDHELTVTAADSANFLPGTYFYQGSVSKGGERYTVDSGHSEVFANFANQTSGYDARDHVRKVLDAIEATLESRATSSQLSRKVGDRELRYIPIADLLVIRNEYKEELAQIEEELARSKGEVVNKNIGFMFAR